MIALALAPIDPAALLDRIREASAGAGAIVSFTGIVRGGAVDELWLDHHETLTLASLEAIGATTRARFALSALTIVHRAGLMLPGEPIVVVAAAAEHRRAAFDAVDHAMDRLKTEAMLWKRERRGDTVRWVDPRAADHADRARWEEQ